MYGAENWEKKKELEEDYVRWIFRLDFHTSRYLMTRELSLEKLKVRWGIRARRYEKKIKGMKDSRWIKRYWKEKVKEE